ncbi:AcvB/VirJ family lysyl-phosphatidylglycerol hydrolase [Siphonobacter aquaeclarae]|jgi:type IV secretory pathway VirJ component|uniref:Type IV secretory pathway, VirJ component n=1 Tax=Siphonobacter aquaeclarae TaxID=563176 RepID=A0A1G9QC67_9BACT|nr:AcvB/VirJ family lysyl-phosphatidylglycerol hydrolase [Siphonobacter aquaeclarae]SDM08664.1 Type IV secretory pathway, VirJ component [Siphonobacter aquaeclarae]
MKRLALLAFLLFAFPAKAIRVDSLRYAPFGMLHLFHPVTPPTAVAIFISGDGGWNAGVITMAEKLAEKGSLVIGVNILQYYAALRKQTGACYYPAADFETMSLSVQKKLRIRQYLKPVLVGYSSGATLVYGMLAQAPAGTFRGALGLGFCPDIELPKPLCAGAGLRNRVLKPGKSYFLERFDKLPAPFIALQGMTDQVCQPKATQAYLTGLPNASLVALPKVGHGFGVPAHWLPAYLSAYDRLAKDAAPARAVASLPELPLTVVAPARPDTAPFTVFLSGDGGWTSFDQSVGSALAAKGSAVVGLDAQHYFWQARTPESTTADLVRVIRYYQQKFNRKDFVLAGYSFGACVAPFVANRLPADLKANLRQVVLLSPSEKGDFEIHISDMLSIGSPSDQYDVLAETTKIKALRPVCLFGSEEDIPTRDRFAAAGVPVRTLPGSHHFDDAYAAIANVIVSL